MIQQRTTSPDSTAPVAATTAGSAATASMTARGLRRWLHERREERRLTRAQQAYLARKREDGVLL